MRWLLLLLTLFTTLGCRFWWQTQLLVAYSRSGTRNPRYCASRRNCDILPFCLLALFYRISLLEYSPYYHQRTRGANCSSGNGERGFATIYQCFYYHLFGRCRCNASGLQTSRLAQTWRFGTPRRYPRNGRLFLAPYPAARHCNGDVGEEQRLRPFLFHRDA